MGTKTISAANRHRSNAEKARRARIRSLASSTGIETGEPIHVIKKKLNRSRNTKIRVGLASKA